MATTILSLIAVNLNGRADNGPIAASGVKVGDVIISAYNTGDKSQAINYFQPVVTTDDEIEQLGVSLTSQNISLVLLRQT